jgi:transcriptional regulator with XRE-family HTH domain
MVKQTQRFQPTFIRQHREAKGMSLDDLAAKVPMDKGNLSKVERGILQYNQEMIEAIADALDTEVAVLLTRGPNEPTPIWTTLRRANPEVRRQIERIAETLLEDKRA